MTEWGGGWEERKKKEELQLRFSLASAPVPALFPQTPETQELPAEEAIYPTGYQLFLSHQTNQSYHFYLTRVGVHDVDCATFASSPDLQQQEINNDHRF